jgi:hypothetical protein
MTELGKQSSEEWTSSGPTIFRPFRETYEGVMFACCRLGERMPEVNHYDEDYHSTTVGSSCLWKNSSLGTRRVRLREHGRKHFTPRLLEGCCEGKRERLIGVTP